MISRRSAKTIADAYHECFTYYSTRTRHSSPIEFHFNGDSLYDFLYVNNFEQSVLDAVRQIPPHDRGLIEFLLGLHTGESVARVKPDSTPNQRPSVGQRLLRDLAEILLKARNTD